MNMQQKLDDALRLIAALVDENLRQKQKHADDLFAARVAYWNEGFHFGLDSSPQIICEGYTEEDLYEAEARGAALSHLEAWRK
jgi:hypothetical protein